MTQPLFNPGILTLPPSRALERACEAWCIARLHESLSPRDSRSTGNTIGFTSDVPICWTWEDVPHDHPTLRTIERSAQWWAREFGQLLRWEREFDVKLQADNATHRLTLAVTLKDE